MIRPNRDFFCYICGCEADPEHHQIVTKYHSGRYFWILYFPHTASLDLQWRKRVGREIYKYKKSSIRLAPNYISI